MLRMTKCLGATLVGASVAGGCVRALPEEKPVVYKTKAPAPAATPTPAGTSRVLRFLARTRAGSPAPQPAVAGIAIDGTPIAFGRDPAGEPTLPLDARGEVVVDVGEAIARHVAFRLPADAPRTALTVAVLPWTETTFQGELLAPDEGDFAPRLRRRGVRLPLALTPVTDANVRGVYVGRYRVPRHAFGFDAGTLTLDPTALYVLRLSVAKDREPNPPLRVLYAPAAGQLAAFTVALKGWPALLPPAGEGRVAPALLEAPYDVGADEIATTTPGTPTSLRDYEANVVRVDDGPFPQP